MFVLIILIPLLAGLATLFLYRHNGKKELLRLDLVQFVYGFVLFPTMFVWLKTFLYYLLSRELDVRLSVGQLFVIDTFFSVVMLFVFAFEIIHIVTKTFNLKYYRDPLYDVFEHSEYYHIWLSHLGMYFGLMFLFVLLALVNIFIPLDLDPSKITFYSLLFVGLIAGFMGFLGLWLSDSKETQFMRLMKLGIGVSFLMLIVPYFVLDPDFNIQHGWYWFNVMAFFSMAICSFLFEKSTKVRGLASKFKHGKWDQHKKMFPEIIGKKKKKFWGLW